MVGALFSGQGSQHIGMGEEMLEAFPRAKYVFDEASEVLEFDLKEMILEGDENTLAQTENTQPALLALSFAQFRVMKDMGELKVTAGAGHSLGEHSAMVAAGVLDFKEAIAIVRFRGQMMQRAVPEGEGAMMAVMGLDAEEVGKLCEWAKREKMELGVIEPANYNSPAQTVVSGHKAMLDWVQANFTADKIGSIKTKVRLIPLKVSAPFHCSLMKPAEDKMRDALLRVPFHAPQWGIIQNFNGQLVTAPDGLRENLIRQVTAPVRWVDCMRTMVKEEINTVGEFGPGKVLTGLMKKIDAEAVVPFNLNSIGEMKTFDGHLERLNERIAEEERRKKILEEEAREIAAKEAAKKSRR
ncbi:MAG: ACP S-malonyltransferase [Bdellovibrionales bacterium]|nr:ACP S-malonyltransferase [Bdellovibrionales bacterium]NQZ20335.1 ACP S-malonyltransferase [Bdellovibrionales bacterium]